MISSIWFEWDSPHVWYHVLIWYSPHAYATVLMVYMTFSSCLTSFLHMLFSIWFALHSPYAFYHVSICCSPHGFQVILLMLDIISPYAVLHMVCIAFSSCFTSCLHMLFSTWLERMRPYAWNHISRTTTNHEDTFSKSIRTNHFVHMVCDTWLYILLLIHYKHYSSRFVLTLKSVGTNLLSVSIRGMLKNHEDIWLPNHREAATLRRAMPSPLGWN